jgi:hypothetical protein
MWQTKCVAAQACAYLKKLKLATRREGAAVPPCAHDLHLCCVCVNNARAGVRVRMKGRPLFSFV